MKKQSVCEYCGKIFEEKFDKDGYGSNYKQECVEHEITHLNLNEKFTYNLNEALKTLDSKYDSNSKIINIKITACYDSYYGEDITYDFDIENNKINKAIGSKIEVSYKNKEEIPTVESIINRLEHHFFIPTINKKYEGRFIFEDYCGGHGADDYMIGDSYMRTIYQAFKDKKVRIEIIE